MKTLVRFVIVSMLAVLAACGGGGGDPGGPGGGGGGFGSLVVCAVDTTNSGWFIYQVEVRDNFSSYFLPGSAVIDNGECFPFADLPEGNYEVRAYFTNLASSPTVDVRSSVDIVGGLTTSVDFFH